MSGEELSIRLEYNFCSRCYCLYISLFNQGSKELFVGKLAFEKIERGFILEPLLRIDDEQASTLKILAEDLWKNGIKPQESVSTQGQLQAIDNHLQDMRKITFNKLEIKG